MQVQIYHVHENQHYEAHINPNITTIFGLGFHLSKFIK